jgi:phosphotransferase system  glucose/maltose/N-acetylglucosamine-specific IIC component
LAVDDPQLAQNLAKTITEVSERASLLVREEIELAKAEIFEKLTKLLRGAVVGLVAGIFGLVALLFFLNGFAWLVSIELFPRGKYYTGFFVVALLLLILGAIGGFLAAKWLKAAAPPTPNMAIDEARKIRASVTGD